MLTVKVLWMFLRLTPVAIVFLCLPLPAVNVLYQALAADLKFYCVAVCRETLLAPQCNSSSPKSVCSSSGAAA